MELYDSQLWQVLMKLDMRHLNYSIMYLSIRLLHFNYVKSSNTLGFKLNLKNIFWEFSQILTKINRFHECDMGDTNVRNFQVT
jgi:hypothetical protein